MINPYIRLMGLWQTSQETITDLCTVRVGLDMGGSAFDIVFCAAGVNEHCYYRFCTLQKSGWETVVTGSQSDLA